MPQTDRAINEAIESEVQCCADCSTDITTDNGAYNDDGDEICESCDENYTTCIECDETTHVDGLYWVDSDPYCEGCHQDCISSCYECGREERHDDLIYNESHGEYYCEDCYEECDDYPSWDVYSNNYILTNTSFTNPQYDFYSKDTFKLIPSKRYMGIEIENNFYDYVDEGSLRYELDVSIAQSRLRRMNDECRAEGKDDLRWAIPNSDRFTRLREFEPTDNRHLGRLHIPGDGSVRRGEHEHGTEVVMQPRRGDILHKDVQTICNELKHNNGAYVSRHCGMHLHIDCRDYDWYHFSVLTLLVKLIEPHVYTWVPPSRLNGRWCKPVSQSFNDFSYVSGRDPFVDFWYDNGAFTNDKYNDKRYHGFNLHSHFQANQGIEIRYHAGTLNPDKIRHWSIFWSNVVDSSYEIAENMRKEFEYGINLNQSQMFKSLYNRTIDKKVKDIEFKYSHTRHVVSIDGYMKASEKMRRYLNLPLKDKPYLLQPMLHHVRNRHSFAVMSMKNIFETFNIPTETSEFMKSRMVEINADKEHIDKCFYGRSSIVEFDKETSSFKYVDCLGSQFPLIDYPSISSTYYASDLAYLVDEHSRNEELLQYTL